MQLLKATDSQNQALNFTESRKIIFTGGKMNQAEPVQAKRDIIRPAQKALRPDETRKTEPVLGRLDMT